jgi:hypothetical protein
MRLAQDAKKDSFTRKDAVVVIRVVQGILFGVFILGIAMMFGDASEAIKLPFNISPLSLTITIYGILGMVACEVFSWRLGKGG